MKNSISFVGILIFITTSAMAQISGVVLDFDTKKPIEDVIIQSEDGMTKSDSRGMFTINKNIEKITFSKLGYSSLTLEEVLSKSLNIYLHPKYTQLEEISVTSKPQSIIEIFDSVKERMSENYIANNIPLEYLFSTWITNPNKDTAFLFKKKVILYNKKNKSKSTLNYKGYYLDSMHSSFYADNFTAEQKMEYSNTHYQPTSEKSPLQVILPQKYIERFEKQFMIQYSREGEEFVIITLIDTDPHGVKFDLGGVLIDNPRLKSLAIIGIFNWEVNLKNYSITSYQQYALSSTMSEIQILETLDNKQELDKWLSLNLSYNTLYFWGMLDFTHGASLNKYILRERAYRDNLFLWNLKTDNERNLIIHEKYSYLQTLDESVMQDAKRFYPDSYINYRLKSE